MTTNSTGDVAFEALLLYLKEERGFDFTVYKRSTLMRRVQRRMDAFGLNEFVDYQDYLDAHPDELAALLDTILINVTSFFRDGPAWEFLAQSVIPRTLEAADPNEQLRVWSAGCASGEEAYTAAMVLAEALGPEEFRRRVKIYATDVDAGALGTARRGLYSARDLQPIAPELRDRYLERSGDQYSFRRDLRRAVIFGRHDLAQDAPISRIDLLLSRNTLMYFNAEAQARILANFRYALKEGGFLFLGKAETLLTRSRLFTPVELKFRIFRRWGLADENPPALFAAPVTGKGDDGGPMERDRMRELAFQQDVVAQLVVDQELNLAIANAEARRLFGIGTREIGRPFHELEVSYRPVELRSLITQVNDDRRAVTVSEAMLRVNNESTRWFDVQLMPLISGEGSVLGIRITFLEVTRAKVLAEELQESRSQLETAYEELQSSNEELETTNEELQSTVEELETTNEELQSTNEELETMNEELQSTNEELETVNDELRERSDQINMLNAFLESVLTSIQSAVVVVGGDLRVQAWNRHAEDLWGVRADEARGHHFAGLDIGLPVEELTDPLRECLDGRSNEYQNIFKATNRRGRPILCRVTISPLREPDRVAGAVVMMEETPEPAAATG